MSQKKTVCIFNRWLYTLGGGEQVTFAYAEALRDMGYETTLLTYKKVNLREAEKKMNVNLSNIQIKYLDLSVSSKLSLYSEKYDLFINTSYLDYFPNRSKNGILSVFFPGEIYLSPLEFIKRSLVIPNFQSFFIYPTHFEGFLGDEYKSHVMYKWFGKESTITFSKINFFKLSITLVFPDFSFSALDSIKFFVNKKQVKQIAKNHNHNNNSVHFTFLSDEPIKQFTIKQRDSGNVIALTQLEIPEIRFILYNIFKKYFPKWEMRLHGGPGITPLSDLESYQKIVTISHFCQSWIKKYWGLSSKVLYPPVNTTSFFPNKIKKNWITNIGRFFVTGHSKKQLDLIRVFKELVDSKQMTDWELHFIGSVHDGNSHRAYYETCLREAKGYPIHFHTAVPFKELCEILSQSKLYWHATGLDEDPNKNPILMEHFGITTVEAMASGCVPVVINAGGQPEIITPGTGFIWDTREKLKKYTVLLTRNERLRIKYMKAAIARSEYFSRKNFQHRFQEIITTK